MKPLLANTANGVARLTLNRPEKRNALNDALIDALREALAAADGDPAVRVVTIEGAGPDFCAGADLAALQRIADADVLENLDDVERLAGLFLDLRRLRKPVVALVRGRAIAGGCGLATACDLVLAEASARFAYTEVRIGFVPAMVMAILRRNVSEKRAFEMIALGESFDAAEAERLGLINRVFADDRFAGESARFVEELATRSASAVMLSKRLLYLQDSMDFAASIQAGADVNVLARMTADTREGVRGFLERGRQGREGGA